MSIVYLIEDCCLRYVALRLFLISARLCLFAQPHGADSQGSNIRLPADTTCSRNVLAPEHKTAIESLCAHDGRYDPFSDTLPMTSCVSHLKLGLSLHSSPRKHRTRGCASIASATDGCLQQPLWTDSRAAAVSGCTSAVTMESMCSFELQHLLTPD